MPTHLHPWKTLTLSCQTTPQITLKPANRSTIRAWPSICAALRRQNPLGIELCGELNGYHSVAENKFGLQKVPINPHHLLLNILSWKMIWKTTTEEAYSLDRNIVLDGSIVWFSIGNIIEGSIWLRLTPLVAPYALQNGLSSAITPASPPMAKAKDFLWCKAGLFRIGYKSNQWGPRTTPESLELLLADNALNREEGARLSNSWLPACELI